MTRPAHLDAPAPGVRVRTTAPPQVSGPDYNRGPDKRRCFVTSFVAVGEIECRFADLMPGHVFRLEEADGTHVHDGTVSKQWYVATSYPFESPDHDDGRLAIEQAPYWSERRGADLYEVLPAGAYEGKASDWNV